MGPDKNAHKLLFQLSPLIYTYLSEVNFCPEHFSKSVLNMFMKFDSFLVRLSLLTMTNPNQLCDVLLFVCSKMADETNLSS